MKVKLRVKAELQLTICVNLTACYPATPKKKMPLSILLHSSSMLALISSQITQNSALEWKQLKISCLFCLCWVLDFCLLGFSLFGFRFWLFLPFVVVWLVLWSFFSLSPDFPSNFHKSQTFWFIYMTTSCVIKKFALKTACQTNWQMGDNCIANWVEDHVLTYLLWLYIAPLKFFLTWSKEKWYPMFRAPTM